MRIDLLASPELTGEWEYKLNQILKGGMTRDQFMTGIRETTAGIVDKIKAYRDGDKTTPEASFSPVNGVRFLETATMYVSEDESVRIRKVLGGRVMADDEIIALINGETIGPFADFRSRQGKPFSASLVLKDGKIEFIFPDAVDNLDIDAIRKEEPLGTSPTDNTPVFETPAAYMSASALEGDRKKGLRISKVILGREIKPDHVRQLLRDGKTELITRFISKRKKPFDAYLLLDDKGKISFEFPPRKNRSREKKQTTAKS